MKIETYRNQEWLENILADVWYKYFFDVAQKNEVVIKYGRKARYRLGSIGLDTKDHSISVITINPLYQDLEVPEYVVVATIVHEMTHYAHGFNSPHAQKQQHPHSGGVIRKEFAERGLEDMYQKQKKWLKTHWPTIVTKYFPPQQPRIRRSRGNLVIQVPWWMREI